jgi:hypothetical protein
MVRPVLKGPDAEEALDALARRLANKFRILYRD